MSKREFLQSHPDVIKKKIGFRETSKLAEIASACWKFQEKQVFQVWAPLMVNASKDASFATWLSHSPQQSSITETFLGFVLQHPASKVAKIAFACLKFQENQVFQNLGSLMVNASKDAFSNAWLPRSPQQNPIAERIVMFVLAKIAFACWKFQEKQGFQVWGCLMINASKNAFHDTWFCHPHQKHSTGETIVMFVSWHPAQKQAKLAFARWKFQENQVFQNLGSLMVNASKDASSNAWLPRSPQQNSIANVMGGIWLTSLVEWRPFVRT
jgi:hypothetical protein